MSSLSDDFSGRPRMPSGRRYLPAANTTLGERLTSDAFAAVLDGHVQSETNGVVRDSAILSGQDTDILGKMLDRVLEEKFHEMLPKLQEAFAEQISRVFREYVSDFHSGVDASADTDRMGQMHESELSEDMMAFAFAMGE